MNDLVVLYGDEPIVFSVCRRTALSHRVRIHVQPDRRVVVEAPLGATVPHIKRAVLRRARWVCRQLGELQAAHEQARHRDYVSGETHWYLGRRYLLKVRIDESGPQRVRLIRGTLEVCLHETGSDAVQKLLKGWYEARARDVFGQRLATICERLPWVNGLPEWRLRPMTKQWGSCSPKGRLALNPLLVKAPRPCVDYVIVHELCHLEHHHHGEAFYRLLERHFPDWRATKRRLDDLSEVILA